MVKTEFFDIAVQQGFYGLEKGGLYGKKDNVRKYWEDIAIKVNMRSFVTEIFERRGKVRVADLGCGSGEGYKLLMHLPFEDHTNTIKDFILTEEEIEFYLGVDISAQMIETGRKNFADKENVSFVQADLSKDYGFLNRGPFDIIISSYSSPSHLTGDELRRLLLKIAETHSGKVVVILDMFGMYSPEWPGYWGKEEPEMKEYNMAWLYLPERKTPKENECYRVKFWDAKQLRELCSQFTMEIKREVKVSIKDRSLLIGRHMDTGVYNGKPLQLREQVNRLFDRDYRGNYEALFFDLSLLDKYRDAGGASFLRLESYVREWNTFVNYTKALVRKDDKLIKEYIEKSAEAVAEEMKMLAWLVRNANRFPVVDFWASIYGPQLAAILRNVELNLPEGLGAGHGLMCNIEIN